MALSMNKGARICPRHVMRRHVMGRGSGCLVVFIMGLRQYDAMVCLCRGIVLLIVPTACRP